MAQALSQQKSPRKPRSAAPALVVLRDRSHIDDAARKPETWLRALPPGVAAHDAVLWTRAAFFAQLAAAGAPDQLRDDDAALWACAGSRSPAGGASLSRAAPSLDALRRVLLQAGVESAAVCAALDADQDPETASTGKSAQVRALFAQLRQVDQRLKRAGVVDEPGALLQSLAGGLTRGGALPAALARFSSVTLVDLVDLSDVELGAVVGLARAGLPLSLHLPVDHGGRGATAGLEPLLRAVEAAHDAPGLSVHYHDLCGEGVLGGFGAALFGHDDSGDRTAPDAPVRVEVHGDPAAEARATAAVVAGWKQQDPRAHIAIALPVVSPSAWPLERARFVDALVAHGLVVKEAPRALKDTAAGRLVSDLLLLARDGAPRERLLDVLTSPAFSSSLSPAEAARVHRTLRRAAARSDIEDSTRPQGGYRHRLERLRDSALGGDGSGVGGDVAEALAAVDSVLALLRPLPRMATPHEHLQALRTAAAQALSPGLGLGAADVKDALDDFAAAAAHTERDAAACDLAAFARVVDAALAARSSSHGAAGDAGGGAPDHDVEVTTLPALLGRRFDHVAIARCVEGMVPRPRSSVPLLSDGERRLVEAAVQSAVGRRVFRAATDDDGESALGALGLEGLWFLGAVAAAQRSLLLTASHKDARGREVAPSAFLLEAQRALGVSFQGASPSISSTRSGAAMAAPSAARQRVTQLARALSSELQQTPLLAWSPEAREAAFARARAVGRADLVGDVERALRMAKERARFFFFKHERPLAEVRGAYAFAVDAARVARAFGASFGLSAERPLTPTRLEAMAQCRMHGFLQHVLKVDVESEPGHSADARMLGIVAHGALEHFFRERKQARVPPTRMDDSDRERLVFLLRREARPFVEGGTTGHLPAVRAAMAYIETAVVRAASVLARDPPVRGVEPVDFELTIGAKTRGPGGASVAPALGAVPLVLPASAELTGAAPTAEPPPPRTIWVGGVIDRVDEGDGGRVVVDYKTASASSVRDKAKAAHLFESHFQLPLYLRLLEHHRPTSARVPLHGVLISLKDGAASDDVGKDSELRGRVTDDAREDGLAYGIGRVVLPILHGTLPPDAGERCDTCKLQRVCRVPLSAEYAEDLDDEAAGGGP